MAHTAPYKRTVPGQVQTNVSKPLQGINLFNDPISLSNDMLSDAWEAMPNDTKDALKMETIATNAIYASNLTNAGKPIDAIADRVYSGSTYYEHVIAVQLDYDSGHDDIIDDLVDMNCTSNTKTVIDISSHNITWTGVLPITSMCIFYTEAKRYICFTSQNAKKLLIYDYSTVSSITLPFYPRKIVSHVNRVFAIDMYNKLWWCRAGDLYTWYGLEEDDDRIVTSTNMLDSTAYTVAAQPDVPRPLSITVTPVSTIDTLGTLAVVGTDSLGDAQTKTYTPISGKYITPDTWGSVTSITAAGHSAVSTVDTIKIGIAPVNGYVTADAGVWTLEQERALGNLAVIAGSLYIWSDENIYIFQGYSYDTFSLTKAVSGIGIATGYTSDCDVSVTHNLAYFQYKDDIYEYNGNDFPKVISRPIIVNGANSNGIYGGIDNEAGKLITDDTYLYVNNGSHQSLTDLGATIIEQHYYYMFDIKGRSWWKRAGLAESVTDSPSGLCNPKYISRPVAGGMWAISHLYSNLLNSWSIKRYAGTTYDETTYVCTKAFSSGVSEDNTLTQINILCRSYWGAVGVLKVYYSTTSWIGADDWTLLKTFTTADVSDDLINMTVNVIGSEICRTHHFRLKLEWDTSYVFEIYGIELRYRKIGRSR